MAKHKSGELRCPATALILICKNYLKTSENDMGAGWSRGSVSDFRVRGHGWPGFEPY